MKRLVGVLLVCCLVLLCGIGCAAASEEKVLRVGLPAPFSTSMIAADAAHKALLMDTLRELAKYTDWEYRFVPGSNQALLDLMAKGELDLMAGVYYREEVGALGILYPEHLTGYTYALLVANYDNDTIAKNDFRSMQHKRIAAASEMNETQRLLGYLALNSVRASILYTDNNMQSVRMLRSGEVDMALISATYANEFRTVARFAVEPYYIVAAPGREDLINGIDDAYSLLLDADPDYTDNLYAKYFTLQDRRDLALTDAEKTFIQTQPPLRVAVPDDLAPLNYYQDDVPSGISMEALERISLYLDMPIEPIRAESIPAAIAMVRGGEADAVLGLPVDDVSAVEADLVMTRTYTSAPRVAICNNQVSYPSPDMRLALIPGMEFMEDVYTGEIEYADTFWGCVDLVNSGKADYTYGISYFLEHGFQSRYLRNINTYTLPGATDEIAIGLRRPVDPLLLTAINKAIHSISEDAMLDIVLHNTTLHEEERSLQYFLYAYPVPVILIVTAFMLLIIAAVITIFVLRARHNQAIFRTQYSDELTGALNLAGFRREANRLLQSPVHFGLSYSTIRNFHFVNERYGYEEGDEVLRRIADAYREDIREGEIFCRVSGGTFVALRRYDSAESYKVRMERFVDQIYEITPRTDPGYHIRMVIGAYLSETPEHGDVFSMMDRANAAQQQIRPLTDVSFATYQEGSYDSMLYLQELESRMESALENGDFLVYLQPKYDLALMKPGGAEALVRWSDNGRIIPPSDFIPQFERNGFIARLDRYVFERCCITLRRWIDCEMPIVPISVNVSRVQLYSPSFLTDYVEIRDRYQIPHGLLELEFTESILFEDVDKLIQIVQSLHANGFECSIDDFGKGYSSLTMLKNIPTDVIKLDAQFFDVGIDEQRDTVIVESVLDIAKSLGMTSVAEGIEHKHQVKLLQMLGCDMVQGYIFSRPLDLPSFEQYLHEKIVEGKDPYAPLGAD